MEEKKSSGLSIFTLIGIIVAVAAAVGAVIYFLERKKAKEDKELEDYLDCAIQ
ncbi:MAG: hypothetical protein II713_03565 [Clostridia bacterium]|nr:hypothetical protein [Clostridia bacterium]